MLNINKTLGENFSISSNMGASFSRLKYDVTGFQGGLKAPSNVFTPNAIDYGNATNDNRPILRATNIISIQCLSVPSWGIEVCFT